MAAISKPRVTQQRPKTSIQTEPRHSGAASFTTLINFYFRSIRTVALPQTTSGIKDDLFTLWPDWMNAGLLT